MTNRPSYAGLDLLATAVILLDERLRVVEFNQAAESLFDLSRRVVIGAPFERLFTDAGDLVDRMSVTLSEHRGFWDPLVALTRPGSEALHLSFVASPVEGSVGNVRLLLELRQVDQQLRVEREQQQLAQSQMNRELIRNLAHEIKNPLGGLRGSAQLLERELDRPDLREYTQVIIKEADRLQQLMERLLTPNRLPQLTLVNIHEVLERVRSLVLAEFPRGIRLKRDYDTSLPEIVGDREQLIQVVLNIARNAAQALASAQDGAPSLVDQGAGEIVLRTRVAHQVTIARLKHRLALDLQVIDNGPGIPPAIRDRMFYPLVSGREGGTGLGLTLAQTYVQYHHGLIECESQPGKTVFRIVLPIGESSQ